MALEAHIFDIGNVLLRFDFSLAIEKIRHHCTPAGETILHLIEPIKAAYEGGRMAREDFQAEVRTILTFTGTDADFVAAWEDIFTENEPMVQLVHQLHGKMPLYLLSNTSDLHMDFIFRQYPVFGLFTDGVYSYKARCSKPEREIYELAQRQFGVEPGRTLFIDDLEPNVRAAREAGFLAHHYDFRQHEALLMELRVGGVI